MTATETIVLEKKSENTQFQITLRDSPGEKYKKGRPAFLPGSKRAFQNEQCKKAIPGIIVNDNQSIKLKIKNQQVTDTISKIIRHGYHCSTV